MTGADRVYPLHYDDFTKPFGEVALFPAFVDDTVQTANWMREAAERDGRAVIVERLQYGQRIAIY